MSRVKLFMPMAECIWHNCARFVPENWYADGGQSEPVSIFTYYYVPGARGNMSSVEERVKKIVAEQLGVKEEEVKNAAAFVEDLGADSLDTVELVMALEEEFETEIPDEEAEKITTVQLAIDYVTQHV